MSAKLIINGQTLELRLGSLLRLLASVAGVVDQTVGSDVTTTDVTPTTVATLPVPSSGNVLVLLLIMGIQSDGSNGFCQIVANSARRSGAGAPTLSQGPSGTSIAILENSFAVVKPSHQFVVSGNNLLLQVVGKAGTTILWVPWYVSLTR